MNSPERPKRALPLWLLTSTTNVLPSQWPRESPFQSLILLGKCALSSKWIISHAKLKTNNKFYKNLAEEIIDSSKKTSLSTKKRNDLHKLAEANFSGRNKNVYKKPIINKEVLINFEKAVIEKKLMDKKKEELDNIKSSFLKFKNHLNFLKK